MAMLVVGMASVGTSVSCGEVIVAFGDSTTAIRSTVPDVYAQILQDELPGLLGESVTVYNAGVGGNNTYDARGRLNTDVRSRHPSTVIVQFGINDCYVDSYVQGDPSRVAIDAATQVGSPYTHRGNYTANLNSIVNTLRNDGARVILMTPNQLRTTGPGAESVWQNDLLGSYAQVVRDVAADQGVELLDVWKMYANYTAIPGHSINDLLVDSQHPGALGHRMVADRLEGIFAPEPGTISLLGIGCLGVAGWRLLQRTTYRKFRCDE
jgi:lysophospholipase L1-like esterase